MKLIDPSPEDVAAVPSTGPSVRAEPDGVDHPNYRYWREHGREWAGEYAARKQRRPKYHIQELVLTHCVSRLGSGRVLEFGCGVGRHLDYLSRIPQVEVFGVDQSPTMLENMRAWASEDWMAHHVRLLKPLAPVPFPDKNFALVFSCEVLIHIRPEHIASVLAELLRLSNGHLLHLEPAPGTPILQDAHQGCWVHDLEAIYAKLGVHCRKIGDLHWDQSLFYVNLTQGPPLVDFHPEFFNRLRSLEQDLESGFSAVEGTAQVLKKARDELEDFRLNVTRRISSLREALVTLHQGKSAKETYPAADQLTRNTTLPELQDVVTAALEFRQELDFLKQTAVFKISRRLRRFSATRAAFGLLHKVRGTSSIELEVLGGRDPHSQGTDVWLMAAWVEEFGGYFPLEHASFDPRKFELRPNDHVPFGRVLLATGPGKVQLFHSPQGARLIFLRNGWSGRVAISAGGRCQVVDLYSQRSDCVEVRLDVFPFKVNGTSVQRFELPVSWGQSKP